MTGCGRVALPRTAELLRRAQALLLALFPAADQKAEEQVLFHSDPELVLQHYGNAILRTAYTYLRNRSDAEDVSRTPWSSCWWPTRDLKAPPTKRPGCCGLPSI